MATRRPGRLPQQCLSQLFVFVEHAARASIESFRWVKMADNTMQAAPLLIHPLAWACAGSTLGVCLFCCCFPPSFPLGNRYFPARAQHAFLAHTFPHHPPTHPSTPRMAQPCVVLQCPGGQQLVVDDVHIIQCSVSSTLCTVQPGSNDDTIFLSMIAHGNYNDP